MVKDFWYHRIWIVFYLAISFRILVPINLATGQPADSKAGKAGFQVTFRDEICAYHSMAIFVLPIEKLHLQVLEDSTSHSQFVLKDHIDNMLFKQEGQWIWQAPATPGLYPITIVRLQPPDSIQLNIFVMVSFSKIINGNLNGCLIGDYPKIPLKYKERYTTPAGFIEITRDNENTWISPHFQLKQFMCKQTGGYPKYTVLKERLLLKLEFILETLNATGIHCKTLRIISGYRTPYYNKAIGNVQLSRHIYGTAADFCIDESPVDGMMDDLNGDGEIDLRDAQVISSHIESLSRKPQYEQFIGGLAVYRATNSHGPFVHVDVRGYQARW